MCIKRYSISKIVLLNLEIEKLRSSPTPGIGCLVGGHLDVHMTKIWRACVFVFSYDSVTLKFSVILEDF